eukprot:TRINITY_DN22644_c0_g1_i1.p1 TRINITY_DN22644_c0_g1~~TRINITY_DN22644_c0_g1_i1.p1  ORF type:complete len:262 (+),score=30.57 TRINITY_DN22644_c0_g1_i1:104-787(+)
MAPWVPKSITHPDSLPELQAQGHNDGLMHKSFSSSLHPARTMNSSRSLARSRSQPLGVAGVFLLAEKKKTTFPVRSMKERCEVLRSTLLANRSEMDDNQLVINDALERKRAADEWHARQIQTKMLKERGSPSQGSPKAALSTSMSVAESQTRWHKALGETGASDKFKTENATGLYTSWRDSNYPTVQKKSSTEGASGVNVSSIKLIGLPPGSPGFLRETDIYNIQGV